MKQQNSNILRLGTIVGMTGVIVASLGTDIFTETEILMYAFVLLATGGGAVAYSLASDLGLIGSDPTSEVETDV